MPRRPRPYRRDSRSTLDVGKIEELTTQEVWDRGISWANEDQGLSNHRKRMERKWDNILNNVGPEPMSPLWERINLIVTRPTNGDDEAYSYLVKLVDEDPYEATHGADTAPPHWTLLHKFAFFGCPRCADYLVQHGGNLNATDDARNRPIDLARYFIRTRGSSCPRQSNQK